jgi:invasion protein IalB
MRALYTLIIAGATAALLSAPAGAVETTKTTVKPSFTAQQTTCQGWGVRCQTDVTPSYCLAEDKCATALPGSALIRYDQLMDTVLGS